MLGILRDASPSRSSGMEGSEGVAISAGEGKMRRPTGGFSRRRKLPEARRKNRRRTPGGRKKRIGAAEGSRAGTTAKERKRKG